VYNEREHFIIFNLFLFCVVIGTAIYISSSLMVYAAPVRNFPMTVIQPDETELHLYTSGHRFFNYLHDTNGNLIRQNSNGWYVYLTVDASGRLIYTNNVAVSGGRFYNLLTRNAPVPASWGKFSCHIRRNRFSCQFRSYYQF
jgi:hypothetical protein